MNLRFRSDEDSEVMPLQKIIFNVKNIQKRNSSSEEFKRFQALLYKFKEFKGGKIFDSNSEDI